MFVEILLFFVSFQIISAEVCSNLSDVSFLFVNQIMSDTVAVPFAESKDLLSMKAFDSSRTTVVYSFGWGSNYQNISTQTVVSAFLAKNDTNILVVDWSKYSGGNYILDSLDYVAAIGTLLGQTLVRMNSEDFQLRKFYLIGHSLGAQMMGYAGRIAAFHGVVIPRITGLDPAGPGFFPLNPFVIALSKADAKFVDIIHTNSAFFGAPLPTGTVDFWPNGGATQPGCPPFDPATAFVPGDDCNHARAWEYYAESVLNHKSLDSFLAVKCEWCEDFAANKCQGDGNACSKMGFNANQWLKGDYFLQTNGQSPYSRDQSGTVYQQTSIRA